MRLATTWSTRSRGAGATTASGGSPIAIDEWRTRYGALRHSATDDGGNWIHGADFKENA